MLASPKDMQYHLDHVLTTTLGSGYTMQPAKVDKLLFRKGGEQQWFLPPFQMGNLTWGAIVGYLLWARGNGWDEVELIAPVLPEWLRIGQHLYSKVEEPDVRRLYKFIARFPYWAGTNASRAASSELWFKYQKDRRYNEDHFLHIIAEEQRSQPKYFTGALYPVYNYATSQLLTDEEYAKVHGITVEEAVAECAQQRQAQLELQVKLGIPTTKGKGK